MELKKYRCTSCGAPLDIKPWSSRAVCASCGTVFFVENSSERGSAGSASSSAASRSPQEPDNPVDVVLVPRAKESIDLDLKYAPYRWDLIGDYDRDPLYSFSGLQTYAFECVRLKYKRPQYFGETTEIPDPLEEFYAELRRKILFFSLLSELTGESFDLDIGDMYLEVAPVYDTRVYKEFPSGDATAYDPARYEEPDVYYLGSREDSLKKQGLKDKDPGITKEWRQSFHSEQDRRIDEILKELDISFKDDIKTIGPKTEKYLVPWLFGYRRSEKYRVWALRFRYRRLFKTVTPADAARLIPEAERQIAAKVGANECIEEIAGRMYREFAAEEQAELAAREQKKTNYSVQLTFNKDGVKYYRSIFRDGKLTNSYFQVVSYKEFGMKDIEDDSILRYFAAHLVSRILGFCKTGGSVGWRIVSAQGTRIDFKLAAGAVGIYNDWV